MSPSVYIGFGSIVVSDPQALTKTIIDGVQEAGVCAIISKGWSDRAVTKNDPAKTHEEADAQNRKELSMLPDTIYNISSIPHDWLFSKVDAVCHHGWVSSLSAVPCSQCASMRTDSHLALES